MEGGWGWGEWEKKEEDRNKKRFGKKRGGVLG